MYKVLKSFCCLLLFSILNLCGVSAVDYLSFNNYEPFKCSKCGKQVKGSLELLDDARKNDEFISFFWNILSDNGVTFPNIYKAFVRSDDRKTLVCSDCVRKDIFKQIKSLVEEFCPEFDFQSPRQQDVENLIRNDSFIQRIPGNYTYNVKGFEDGKCICSICLKDQEEDKVDVFKSGSYYVCIGCGRLFHEVCMEEWIQESFSGPNYFSCPNCRNRVGLILQDGNSVTKEKKSIFEMWVKNGCSLAS